MKIKYWLFFIVLFIIASSGCNRKARNTNLNEAQISLMAKQKENTATMKKKFLQLCDSEYLEVIAQTKLTERKEARGFYWDSYAVRSLCVAYDLTGNQKYLNACKLWSKRMIEFQDKMMPAGAYYMSYGRKPGKNEGDWFVADCSSIALGVLATSVRCSDSSEKQFLLNSVKSFSSLVSSNWVRSSGGVCNGLWPKSYDEWWCPTALYGSLSFQLYKETADTTYLRLGLGTIDWLNQINFLNADKFFPQEEIKPVVIMYCLEAYSSAFPFLDTESERYKLAMAQWDFSFKWMSENQQGKLGVDYVHQWGSKFGGLPFHIYTYASFNPGNDSLILSADQELGYVFKILEKPELSSESGVPEFYSQLDQLSIFTMFSLSQKISQGTIYRSSKEQIKN